MAFLDLSDDRQGIPDMPPSFVRQAHDPSTPVNRIFQPLDLAFPLQVRDELAHRMLGHPRPLPGGRYVMWTPFGEMAYQAEVEPRCRTVDFVFATPGGENVLPTRVVPHGVGAVFTFTGCLG